METASANPSYSSKSKINHNFGKLLISREGILRRETKEQVRELSYFRMSTAGASLRETIMHQMRNCFYFSFMPFLRSAKREDKA